MDLKVFKEQQYHIIIVNLRFYGSNAVLLRVFQVAQDMSIVDLTVQFSQWKKLFQDIALELHVLVKAMKKYKFKPCLKKKWDKTIT